MATARSGRFPPSKNELAARLAPPEGSFCQEASPGYGSRYVPCGRPASVIVRGGDPQDYYMCGACGDHNVRNRGARYVLSGEEVRLWVNAPTAMDALRALAERALPAAFQGLHARHLLVVIDEAGGVPKSMWDAVETLIANEGGKLLGAEESGSRPGEVGSAEDERQAGPPEHEDVIAASAEFRDWMVAAMRRLRSQIERRTEFVKRAHTAAQTAAVYRDMRVASEAADEAIKLVGSEVTRLKSEACPAAFDRESIRSLSMTTPEGDTERVTTSTRLRASIIPDRRLQAYGWLRNNGLGDLIQETVSAETLSAAATHMLTEGRELPDDMFRTYYQNSTSVTRIRTRK